MFYYIMESSTARALFYGFTAILFIVLLISIKREPRRFANCVLLAMLVVCLWQSIVLFIDYNQGIDMAGLSVLPIIILLTTVGIGLIINGCIVLKKEGFSLAHLLPLMLGLCIGVVLYSYIFLILQLEGSFVGYTVLQRIAYAMIMFAVNIILYFPIMLIGFYGYSAIYQRLPITHTPDFIIVLGCGLCGEEVSPILAQRLDKAIETYHKTGQISKIVVSGGKGADEAVPEALAMKNYLLLKGIPEEMIIMEDQSTTTRENMRFSHKIIKQIMPLYSGVFVTNNFHVLRSAILAKNLQVPVQGIGCRTAGYYRPAAAIREGVAIILSYKKVFIAYAVLCLAGLCGTMLFL